MVNMEMVSLQALAAVQMEAGSDRDIYLHLSNDIYPYFLLLRLVIGMKIPANGVGSLPLQS